MSAVSYRIAKLAGKRGYRVDAFNAGVWTGAPAFARTYTGARFARWRLTRRAR